MSMNRGSWMVDVAIDVKLNAVLKDAFAILLVVIVANDMRS